MAKLVNNVPSILVESVSITFKVTQNEEKQQAQHFETFIVAVHAIWNNGKLSVDDIVHHRKPLIMSSVLKCKLLIIVNMQNCPRSLFLCLCTLHFNDINELLSSWQPASLKHNPFSATDELACVVIFLHRDPQLTCQNEDRKDVHLK